MNMFNRIDNKRKASVWKFLVVLLTLFTYSQEEIERLKEGNCKGKSSWEDTRRADAAMIDGLNSNNFVSAIKRKGINQSKLS